MPDGPFNLKNLEAVLDLVFYFGQNDVLLREHPSVSAGDVIENTYRVEGLAGGRLELTYLPLDIRQTLSTGEAS